MYDREGRKEKQTELGSGTELEGKEKAIRMTKEKGEEVGGVKP